MKVLFAVNNENISESIIKKYQQEYKEIISVKNVYYFNAIVKELQRDKTYDRIVISEDLQPLINLFLKRWIILVMKLLIYLEMIFLLF